MLKRVKGLFNWKKPSAAAPPAGAETTLASTSGTTTEREARASASGTTLPDRHPADRPRRRRRRRRAESPTGLPLYAEEPHDDEMSLFKHDGTATRTSSRVDPRDLYPSGGSSLNAGDDGASSIYRPSMDAASELQFVRSRSPSDAPSAPQSLFAYPNTPPRQSSDLSNELGRPTLGHRSTQSSSSLSAASPPLNAGSRNRSSTLRSIFNHNHSASVLSSSLGSTTGRSPYGQGNGSTSRLASASSASIASRISAPLQHTLVSSSFVFPKSGPTASQLAFISSRENLGAYGYGDGVAQIPTYDHSAPSPPLSASEPSSVGNSSSMAVPIPAGRFRAGSVSSQLSIVSSPLSRSHSAPGSPTQSDDSHHSDHRPLPSDPPIPSYEELHPPSPPSTSLPPSTSIPSLSLQLPADDSPATTPLHSALSTPRSHSPVSGEPSPALPLPALVFNLPTPTSSALPSPVISGGPMPFTGAAARRDQNISSISEASFMTQESWASAQSKPSVVAEAVAVREG